MKIHDRIDNIQVKTTNGKTAYFTKRSQTIQKVNNYQPNRNTQVCDIIIKGEVIKILGNETMPKYLALLPDMVQKQAIFFLCIYIKKKKAQMNSHNWKAHYKKKQKKTRRIEKRQNSIFFLYVLMKCSLCRLVCEEDGHERYSQ